MKPKFTLVRTVIHGHRRYRVVSTNRSVAAEWPSWRIHHRSNGE